MTAATYSDAELGFSDLETFSSTEVALTQIHHQLILGNQLLGCIVAVLILSYGFGLFKFFHSLVTKNIINYM